MIAAVLIAQWCALSAICYVGARNTWGTSEDNYDYKRAYGRNNVYYDSLDYDSPDYADLADDSNLDNGFGNSVDESESGSIELLMPKVRPTETDTYLCHSIQFEPGDKYIVKYVPKAEMQVAHHVLLFGCSEPYSNEDTWVCGEMHPVCKSGTVQSIMYAWAKNAPALDMPEGVGFHVGGNSGVKFAVLQVHYADVSTFQDPKISDQSGVVMHWEKSRKRYLAGIYLLADSWTKIPPHSTKYHVDVGCEYPKNQPPIYPFRFRVHAHKHGVVVTGYRIRNGKWLLIGRGDPQRPQAFYKVFNDVDIKPSDKIAIRCTMNTEQENTPVSMGFTHVDEMCNFYIMHFYDDSNSISPSPMTSCIPLDMTDKTKAYTHFPKDSDTALAVMERTSGKNM